MPTASTPPQPVPPRPLEGIRILDLGGIGPGPFAAMVLADLGAEVIRVHRPQEAAAARKAEAAVEAGTTAAAITSVSPVLDRGKKSLVLDLKAEAGRQVVIGLLPTLDAVIEGFRPGVAERMGLGPGDLLEHRPELVYGRITGWGQTGPDALKAGHDMNYIAGSGLLAQLGRAGEAPQFPANLAGDFGGGGMQLALGIVSALLRAKTTGTGSVVDAAMVDGANLLWAMQFGFEAQGVWREARGENLLDSGAPFYDVYTTADGGHVSVGCIEPQFFAEFVEKLEIADRLPAMEPGAHRHPKHWAAQRAVFTEVLGSLTRDQVAELFAGSDACTVEVRSWAEAEADPHNRARSLFYRDGEGVRQPAPAPRFADAGGAVWAGAAEASGGQESADGEGAAEVLGGGEPYARPQRAPHVGEHTEAVLASAGFTPEQIEELRTAGAVS